MKRYLDLEKIYTDLESRIDPNDKDVLIGNIDGLMCSINIRNDIDSKKYNYAYFDSLYSKYPGFFNLKIEDYIVEI